MRTFHPHVDSYSYSTASSAVSNFFKPIQIIANWISSPSGDLFGTKRPEPSSENASQAVIESTEPNRLEGETLTDTETVNHDDLLRNSLFYRLTLYAFILLVGLLFFLLVLVLEMVANHFIHQLIYLFDWTNTRKATIFVTLFENGVVAIDILLFAIYVFRQTWLMVLKPKI